MTEHVSRHLLEHVIASETRTSARAPTRRELQAHAHVLGCDVCTTRKRSIETARARFLALAPADPFARATLAQAENASVHAPLERRWMTPASARALGTAVAVAIAVAAVLWVRCMWN